MKNEHITNILDAKVFGALSADEKRVIDAHVAECAPCLKSYRAARIAEQLLKTHAAQTFDPAPFFQSRVMANIREKRALLSPLSAFEKMWRAARTLLALMTASVAVLLALTVFAPEFNKVSSAGASIFDGDLSEMVILNERATVKEPTNEQVFQIIYESGDDSEK